MALTYSNSSIATASAVASGTATQLAMRDALVAHPSLAWTVEDEFDSAGGAAIHWLVMKNSTVVSGVGLDYRVVIAKRAVDGVIWVMVGETYNTATKVLGNFAPATNAGTQWIMADGSYGGTGGAAVTQTYPLGATFTGQISQPVMPAAGFGATSRFAYVIEKEFALFSLNNVWLYLGALTDLIVPQSGLAPTPAIGIANLYDNSLNYCASITRQPILPADAPCNVALPFLGVAIMDTPYMQMTWLQAQALLDTEYGYPDVYQNNRIAASELAFLMSAGTRGSGGANNRADKVGSLRAKYKYLRCATVPYSVNSYDLVVIDGRKHLVMFTSTGNLGSYSSYITFSRQPNVVNSARIAWCVDTGIAA